MELFTYEIMSTLFESRLGTAEITTQGWKNVTSDGGSVAGKYINWLTFTDNAKAVTEDVQRIRNHPLVPKNIPIHGYIYDCKTGLLSIVPEAAKAGQAIK